MDDIKGILNFGMPTAKVEITDNANIWEITLYTTIGGMDYSTTLEFNKTTSVATFSDSMGNSKTGTLS